MAWPTGVTLRTCSLGPDFGIVSGDDYGCDIVVSVSRPMMTWGATGSGGIGDQDSLSFTPGQEVTFQLPVTDQAGWYVGGLPIDVSDGQQSHVYTLTIKPWIYNSLGRPTFSNATLTLTNLAVPTGADTLDLDKSVATAGAQGGTVTIPDLVGQLQASVETSATDAAASASAAAASAQTAHDISNIDTSDDVVSTLVADPQTGPKTTAALNAASAPGQNRDRHAPALGIYLPEAEGAIGDDSHDDGPALNAALTAAPAGATVSLRSGQTYRSTVSVVVPDGVTVASRGATIHYVGTATGSPAVEMGNGSRWVGYGTVNLSPDTSTDGSRAHFKFGNYYTGVGVTGGKVEATLTGGWSNCNGVFITGDSSDIDVDLIVPDNALIGRPVLIHWGNADNHSGTSAPGTHTAGSPTTHPYNIRINKVDAGRLTCDATDAAVVTLSAAYDVTIGTVRADAARKMVAVLGGDWGFAYADPAIAAHGARGLDLGNVIGLDVRNYGVTISGRSTYDATIVTSPTGTFGTVRLAADGSATSLAGMMFQYCERFTVAGIDIAGFAQQGVNISNLARDVVISGGSVRGNGYSGIAVGGSSGSEAVRSTIHRVTATGNGTRATVNVQRAGFAIQADRFTVVVDCTADDAGSGTQLFGIFQTGTNTKSLSLRRNYISTVASGGTGIYTETGYDDGFEDVGNNFGSGVTTQRNNNIARTTLLGNHQMSYLQGPPAAGTWGVGDICWNAAPAAGGAPGWVCITAGTPGTWKAMGNLAT